jgi:hypothetical protein
MMTEVEAVKHSLGCPWLSTQQARQDSGRGPAHDWKVSKISKAC